MNKYYFIAPLVLLATFAIFYRGAREEMDARAKIVEAQNAADKAAKEKEKEIIDKKAQAEALARQAQRDKEETEKRLKKEKDYADAMAKLKLETDGYITENNNLTKEINELEISLLNTRSQRDRTSREAFELSKLVELAKINRRSAELEIQRLIEMVRAKAGASSLAAIPTPPPAKK